jgi:hypothetical protein
MGVIPLKTELMKTYILTVSTRFPATHKRKGEPTFFQAYIQNALINDPLYPQKLQTIRKNYPLWEKRIKQVQEGKAILKVCYWKIPGGRFVKGNELVEICQLDKDSGVGVQKLEFLNSNIYDPASEITYLKISELAKNDGLSFNDFKEWFKNYDLSEPLVIIHLTKFRY